MEELLANAAIGWGAILALEPVGIFGMEVFLPKNFLYAIIGVTVGTAVGVLPGLGPVATIALLLPVTYGITPLGGLIMLAGIYYGAQYGGSTTAILVNLPGESSSIVTCLDGYQMSRQGRAGVALATAALGSFFAGTVGTFVVMAFAPPLAELAFKFGPAEYFSLMALGLVGAIALASGSALKAVAMVLIGLLLGLIGADVNSGYVRFSFGLPELADGLEFVAIAVGLFGLADIMLNLGNEKSGPLARKLSSMIPRREDWRRMTPAILRGTGLGAVLGMLPGGGAGLASFGSYAVEKRLSKYREELGKGAIEGVAGPESANNAAAQTSFIPMLSLGIPSNATMALMIGAMLLHGIQPGPQVMTSRPELFWGLIVSMWLGNFILIILNLPLIGVWVRLLRIPYEWLYPSIIVFCCIGVYSVSNSGLDVILAAVFALFGLVLYKLHCEPAPLVLGFVLGPLLEENFRRAMTISDGSYSIFVQRPISLGLLLLAVLFVASMVLPAMRRRIIEAAEG